MSQAIHNTRGVVVTSMAEGDRQRVRPARDDGNHACNAIHFAGQKVSKFVCLGARYTCIKEATAIYVRYKLSVCLHVRTIM